MVNLPKKTYTNAEVMAEVLALKALVEPIVPQVNELMEDKKNKIIAEKAVAQWLVDHPQQPSSTPSTQSPEGEALLNQTLLKYLGIALGIISAMVILYGQLKGVAK